jgi:signal transduction histidine kinase/CheY-like chemotaxis protein/Tfp pilus assembly protein PilF
MNTQILEIEKQILSLLEEAEAIRVSNPKQSITLAKEALEYSSRNNIQQLIAKSSTKLSFYLMINGQYNASFPLANDALLLCEKIQDEQGLAEAKFTLASIYYKTDNLQLGLKYLVESIFIFKKYNNNVYLSKACKALGTIYEYFGDEENAIRSYDLAIDAAREIGDVNMKTNAYNPLSGLYLNQGNIEKAEYLIEKAIAQKLISGDIKGLAFSYYGRGKIYIKTKEYALAEKDLQICIDTHIEMGEILGLGFAYQKMGVLFEAQQNYEKAKEMFLKAFHLSEKHNIRMIRTKACLSLYQVLKRQNSSNEAMYFLEQYHEDIGTHVQDHTYQIVNSYNMIHIMQAKAEEDKVQLERLEMIEKNNRAETAVKVRQDFLSNMSHEIRTPLNAVITIPKLLKERADPEDQQLLDALQFSSNNLLLLINDVLDFSKLEAGKMELEYRPNNIKLLLHNIINTYDSLAKEKGLTLYLIVDENIDSSYELDEIKLTQILNNLLGNAIKFTDNGSVHLVVKKMKDTEDGVQLKFKVVDTGIGIPDDFLAEIFDSFSQPKLFLSKKHVGTGLGLAIVKKLVELYGSDIKITTQINEGTTFSFDLILKPCNAPITTQTTKGDTQLKNLHVLVAEDNKVNMLVAKKLLSRWGIEADWAKDGVEAVEKATAKKYDIILMDIHMPEKNGYDATINIRQEGSINNDSRIYALTADITANMQLEYGKYFNGFLRKPIEVDKLYEVLNADI